MADGGIIPSIAPQFETMPQAALTELAKENFEREQTQWSQMTAATNATTNFMEAGWRSENAYQKAQLDLQTTQAKLNYQNDYNKLLEQSAGLNDKLYPMKIREGQIALDQAEDVHSQHTAAMADADSYKNAIRQISPDDPNLEDKIAAAQLAHPDAANDQVVAPGVDRMITEKRGINSRNTKIQFQRDQVNQLQARQNQGLLDSDIDVRDAVYNKNQGTALTMQTEREAAKQRLQNVMTFAKDANTKAAAQTMLGQLFPPPDSSAPSVFNSHGRLGLGFEAGLQKLETDTGLINPYAGVEKDVTVEYNKDAGGYVTKTELKKVPVTGADFIAKAGATLPTGEKNPLAGMTADEIAKSPIYNQAVKDVTTEYIQKLGLDPTKKEDVAKAMFKRLAELQAAPPQAATTPPGQQLGSGVQRAQIALQLGTNNLDDPRIDKILAAATGTAPPAPTPTPPPPPPTRPPISTAPGTQPPPTRPVPRSARKVGEAEVAPPAELASAASASYQKLVGDLGELGIRPPPLPVEEEEGWAPVPRESTGALSALTRMPGAEGEGAEGVRIPPRIALGNEPIQGVSFASQAGDLGVENVAGAPLYRAMSYGPIDNEYTHSTNYGPDNHHLQLGEIAVSPNLLAQFPYGSRVNIVDANGRVLVHGARVGDYSYYTEGHPTYNSFEVWNAHLGVEHAHLVRVG